MSHFSYIYKQNKVLPLYQTQCALSYWTLTHLSQAQDNMC